MQTKKPGLKEVQDQVQDYSATKWKSGDSNHGLPNSAAHVLSNILVLSNLLHAMTHREEHTGMANWGTWRGLHHPRRLQATPRDGGIIICGPQAAHLWHWLGRFPTCCAAWQSGTPESHSSQPEAESIYPHFSQRSGASSRGLVLSQSQQYKAIWGTGQGDSFHLFKRSPQITSRQVVSAMCQDRGQCTPGHSGSQGGVAQHRSLALLPLERPHPQTQGPCPSSLPMYSPGSTR